MVNENWDFWKLLDSTWGDKLEEAQLKLYQSRTGKVGIDEDGFFTNGFANWMADYTTYMISWYESQGASLSQIASHVDADLRAA